MSETRAPVSSAFAQATTRMQRRGFDVLGAIRHFQMGTRLSRTDSFANIRAGMISLQVFYEGNVQGVGFRWSVRHIAKGFDVTGWVRNLADGRVELQINGEEGEVRGFLDAIAQSELHALIRKQVENRLEKPVTARGFEIRYD
jgi:acylphosphatase